MRNFAKTDEMHANRQANNPPEELVENGIAGQADNPPEELVENNIAGKQTSLCKDLWKPAMILRQKK